MIHCFLEKQGSFLLRYSLIFIFFFCAALANAQTVDCSINANCSDPYCQFAANIEKGCNCFDNVDNDGDGKADKADSNCATYYGMVFVGEDADCSIVPPGVNTPFDLVSAPITSDQNTADTQSKVSVGDVDGDGIPDAVITSKWNSEIRVIATANGQADGTSAGQVKSDFKTTGAGAAIFSGTGGCAPKNLLFEHENLIADIDGDGDAELFAVVSNRGGNPSTPPTCFFLVALTYAPDNLQPMYNAVQIGSDRPGTFGIADMDGDGKAEIYMRDRIYAAETGKLLATGNGNWDLDITSGPVAVDVVGDDKMELVCGTKIFSIPDLSNRNPATPQNLTLVADMNTITANKAYVKLAIDPVEYGTDTHSMCSVADIDRDGNMDVVISGALNSVSGPTTVFYWNVAKGTVSHYVVTDPLYANGWPWGTGRVNLGDVNGDGNTDLTFIAGSYLHSLTTDAAGNLVPLWATPRTINDTRSGVLTVSVYDFNNDGDPEVVYRDSQELAVVDGATGQTKLWSAVCQSHTYTEGPVIADVNGDGSTDICVPCNTNNSFNINAGIQQQALGQFRLYYSSGNEWLPTRKVWNQPGYFVVNINDDLTLPFPQLDQNLVFGEGDCLNGLPGPQMPMNVFLNQVPYLAANGCPVYPAPDLSFIGDNPDNPGVDENGDGVYNPTVEVIPPICGDLGISVRFNIVNDGDLPITANIPVSFFIGDPTDPGITSDSLIHSTTLPINNLDVDSTYTSPFITFNGTGSAFRLYIVLNNNGTILPIDPTGSVSNECRIDNNIYSAFIQPDPFTTRIEKIQDNFKCENTAPNNGEVRVRIFKAGVEVTDYSQYAFQWYTGTSASYSPIAGATNYNLTGLAEGDYTAIVTNTVKGCVGLPVDTTIVRLGNDPEVIINVISHQTVCDPPNGQLQAQITGGNTGFTFEWFDIALNPLGVIGNTANNLVAGNYLVRVSKDGCSKNSLPQTVDGPVVPDAQASTTQNVVDCLNPTSGAITATALFNGAAQDPANYSFDWYYYNNATSTRGSILPGAHGTGASRTGLPVGHYQVVVTDLATKCAAVQAPVTEITSQTVIPTAVITELAPQTSCDPADPNGRLQGAVDVGGVIQDPSAYTFEWFKGDNTLAANAHTSVSAVNGSIAEAVAGGGVYYTLRVTTANNCSDTEKLIITEDLNLPLVTLATTDNGICDPALATSTYNGTVTASVTFDGVAVADFTNYQITWHNGALATDPPIAGETTTLLDERNGGSYTVVVERTDLSCVSAPVTGVVNNAVALPVISTDSIPSTNCVGGAANGGVVVTGITPADTYTYRWFDPANALIPGATTNSISGRQGGAGQNYTVEVTLGSTGCRNSFATAIPDNKINPILTLTPSDNSICDGALGFNGAITSTFTDTNTLAGHGYTYVWSTGSDMSSPITGETGSSITQRNGGFYTATIRNTTLNCMSSPVTTQIINNQILPAISAVPTPSTNCSPAGADNGAITASVTNGLAGQTFAFQWSKGNLVADPDVPSADGGNTATIVRQAGNQNYIVSVRNNQTGCENTLIQTIADNSVVPALTLLTTDNSICDPLLGYNGTVYRDAITDVNAQATDTYSFVWCSGSNMSAVIAGQTTATLPGRNGGFYTATVKNDRLGCVSNPVTAEVNNNQILPAIAAVPTPSTNCSPAGADNGAITASVTNGLAGQTFAFQWSKGNLVADPDVPSADGGNTATIVRQAGNQNYIVSVRNNQTGCENTLIQTIADNSVVPALTLLTTDNSICDPLLGYNGTVYRDAITDVNAQATDTYSFVWSSGSNMSAVIAGQTTATLPGRNGGFYTATVKNDRLGCVSNPVTAEVNNNQILPAIAAVPTPSTNCSPAGADNGAITASVTNGLAGQTFAFQWSKGNLVADPDVPSADGGNTATIIRQAGNQNYIVLVRNNQTGCENTLIQTIADNSVVPALTLLTTDNSICDPLLGYNGTVYRDAITDVNAQATDTYSFVWSSGSNMSAVIAGQTTATLPGRNGGFYTATVKNDRLGCVSNPVTAQVMNNQIFPAIDAVPTPSTHCPGGTANGAIAVTVSNGLAGQTFSFDWYEGTLTSDPIVPVANGGQTANVSGLDGAQNYLVEATNDQTGCKNTFIQLLADESEVPVLTLTPSPNSICDAGLGYNGSITQNTLVDSNGLGTDTYTFAWATGSDMTATIAGEATSTLAGQNGGLYTATVRNNRLNCISNPVTVEIVNNQILPAISATPTPSTNCDPALANGEITVNITNAVAGQTFTYEWHKGNTLSDPAVAPANGGTTATIINQQGGFNYTVGVTIDQTGCENSFTQALQDVSALPTLTLTPTANTICVPNPDYDGSIAGAYADVNNEPGHNYTYAWSRGMNMGMVIVGQTTSSLTKVDGGFYTATVTNTTLGCTSNPAIIEVLDNLTLPTISFAVTPSTNCVGGNPNGTITASVTNGLPSQTFGFAWFEGNLNTDPSVPAAEGGNTPTIFGQQGGQNFTVEAVINQTGCENTATILLGDDSEVPVISPLGHTDNINCTLPFNGTAFVDAATPFTYHGVTPVNPYAGFTLTWSGGTVALDQTTALAAGTYTLQVTAGAANTVTNNNDNCISAPVSVTILDDLTLPVVSVNVTDQTSCDPGQPNGQLQATVTSGAGTYTIDWFNGIGAGAIGAGLPEASDGQTTAVLASNNYTVLVANTVTRCQTTVTSFLPDNIILPTLNLVQTSDVTNCAAPNGVLTATPTLTSAADGDFTIYYLKDNTSDPTTVKTGVASSDDADFVRSNLGPGYFASLVRDEVTHCESQVAIVQIEDNTDPAVITINALTTATFCNAGNDGGIDINVTGGVAPYTYAWHVGGPTNAGPYDYINDENGKYTPTFDPDAPPFPIGTEDINLVSAGFYSVEVVDARGCGTVFSETVPFQDAPQIAVTKTNSTQCDPLNGDGSVRTEIVGTSNYSVHLYLGLNPATATPLANSNQFGLDGIDNDADGFIDVLDPDSDAGGFPLCGDGLDNDGDAKIDSDDEDCDGGLVAVCSNGIDDDGDGLVDSDDPNCDGAFQSLQVNTSSLDPGDYLIKILDNTINCEIFKTAIISVDALEPVVTLGTIEPNTTCPGAVANYADGSVEITITKDPRDATTFAPVYEITSITAASATPATNPALYPLNIATATATVLFTNTGTAPYTFDGGFGAQTYTINVEETTSGCTTARVVSIPNQPEIPQLLEVDVTNESFCAPLTNGSAEVVTVNPVAVADYDYTWYTNAALTTVFYAAPGGAGGGELLNASKNAAWLNPMNGLGMGTREYYVRGIRKPNTGPGAGCPTPAIKVVVQDEHVTPVATLSSMPNTSCDPVTGEGRISIAATTASADATVAASTYQYDISLAGIPMGSVNNRNGALSTPFTGLLDDATPYAIVTMNEENGCVTRNEITVTPEILPTLITNHTFADQLICYPNGNIQVTEIQIDRAAIGQGTQTFNAALASDFDFKWFRAATATPGTFDASAPLEDNIPADINRALLEPGTGAGQYASMGSGTYYVIATRKAGPTLPVVGLGCPTTPLRVDIDNLRINPVVNLTPFSNTSCSTTIFEGQIDVNVTDGSPAAFGPFDYNYSWPAVSSSTTPATPGNPYSGSSLTDGPFVGLEEGQYTISVFNNQTGCQSTATTTILKNTTPIFVTQTEVLPQFYCTPSGRLEVTQISYEDRNGATQNAPLADFDFSWTRSGIGSVGTMLPLLDSTAANYPAIGAGLYSVFATRTSGSPGLDCVSAPVNLEILDRTKDPVITLTPFSNTSCTAAYEGQIEVDVTDGSVAKVPPVVFNYNYTWTAVSPAGLTVPGPQVGQDGLNNLYSTLQEGTYRLRALNAVTGCASEATTTIIKNQTPVFVQDVDMLPQFYCDPSGNLNVVEVTFNDRDGVTQNGPLNNFTYTWSRNTIANVIATTNPAAPVAGHAGTELDSVVYNTIGSDEYWVVATRAVGTPGAGCSSAPFRVDIADKRVTPVITLTPFSNTSCTAAFEGEIEVDVTDGSVAKVPATAFTYDYTWSAVSPAGLGLPPNQMAQNGLNNLYGSLQDGTYRLQIENTVTGCTAVATTTIIKNQTPVFLTVVNPTPQFYCEPSGRLEVTGVTYKDRDGVDQIGNLAHFTFNWSRGTIGNNVATTLGSAARGAFLDSLAYPAIGFDPNYYVVATRTAGAPGAGCSSAPIKVEITDRREYPVIALTPFSNTSCTAAFEGEIEIDILDNSAAKVAPSTDAGQPVLYDYTWTDVNAAGLTLPMPANGQTGSDNLYQNLEDGTYRLTAVNTITGCSSSATTTIIKNQTPVFLTVVNPTPQFYCEPSGRLEVTGVTYKDRDGVDQIGNLAHFTFNWSRGTIGNNVATTLGSAARGAFLDSLAYPAIGFDPNYYVVATRTAGAPGAGCSSAPIKVEITDRREYPVIALTPFSNTSCTMAFEGEIEIDIDDNSAAKVAPSTDAGQPVLYDYTWADVNTAGLTLPLPANGQTGSDNLYQNLEDGTYRLTAVNTITGCSSSATTTIIKNQTPIFVQDVAMVPQLYCAPSGHLEVRSITYNDRDGVGQAGPLADFTFAWTRNDLTTVAGNTDGSVARGAYLDSLSYTGPGTIGYGTYYVVARRNAGVPGAGCQSAPFKMDISDKRENPVVNFTTIANTSCDNNFDGRITVLSNTSNAPGAGSNYDIQWISVPAGNVLSPATNVGASYTTALTDIIGPGDFTVRVTNRITSCSSDAVVTMISNPQPVEILTVNKIDQMICFPDGSIAVSAVSPAVVPDYTFTWHRGASSSAALEDASNSTIVTRTLDNTNYSAMGADAYFVVGQKLTALGSGCFTPPFRVNIEDLHRDPTLAFTFDPNSSCDVTNPNGQIIATASERDGSTDNYTFVWSLNNTALPAVTTVGGASPVSQLTDAYEGQYTLVVTNSITGCDFTSGITVDLDHNISLPNIITVDTFDPLDCLGSGSAEVTAISIGGGAPITGPTLGTDFQFEWYQDDFAPANQMANTAPLNPGLNAGRYFVRVQDLTTDCKSSPTQVVVLEDDIVYPVVTINQTALQVRCVSDEGTAALAARGDGNTDTNPDYVFAWFNNLDTSGPSFSNTSTITDQLHGEYSVLVTNNATGCSASEIYVIRDDSDRFIPKLSLNSESRTDCLDPNGTLLVREVGYDPNDLGYPYPSANYSAEWYTGENADVSQAGSTMDFVPGFNRNWLETGLDVGPYTVKITDNNTGCFIVGTRAVADERTLPVVAITQDNPLINCDPARPNAQLSATADGGRVGGYAFNWYNGTVASGAVISGNNKLISIPMGDFTVRVTNDITNCFADATASVTDGRLTPPTPAAVLVFDRMRCDYPDGWVTANVGGITFNYSFDWYEGEALKPIPDFTGVNYQNRDIGFYTVTAMDQITGCVSLPTSIEVKDMRVIPQVIVNTTPSFCEELPGSVGGTGTAQITLDPSNVVTDDVIWTLESDAMTVGIGSYLTNVLPGFYQANVITSYGCEAFGVGEVKTEVFSYNLVSMNGDQKNDEFRIDCITQFPNNNVKIFNRAGVLVYEADGYDNDDVVFKGIGERGVYAIGNHLPVGTYFYIIDKRDGSKPKTGYLELVR